MGFKKLERGYLKKIIELYKKSNVSDLETLGTKHNLKKKKEYILDTLRRGMIKGYFENNSLVGCGGVVLNKKQKIGEIRHIFVDGKHHGEGIGKKIMKELEGYLKKKNMKEARLNVLVKNKAVGFYEKLGYKKHVYVMKKGLK